MAKAYALREDVKDTFSDAAVTAGGRELPIGQLLQDNDGVIVTDDPVEQEALETVPALKNVPVPDPPKAKSKPKGDDKDKE